MARNAELMWSYAAEDVVIHSVAESEEHAGRDYLIWAQQDLFNGFPDCEVEIINQCASDDQALVEVRWQGTNRGEYRGKQLSGEKRWTSR